MKKIFAVGFSILSFLQASAQLIDVTPESQVVCGGTGAPLSAVINPPGTGGAPGSAPTTSYAISSIAYAPDPLTSGTAVSLTDDSQTGLIPIGFSFCFYGNTYTNFIIGSNNWIGFQTGETSTWVTVPIPSATGNAPRNTIMGPWQDINPGAGGTVRYQMYGTAPFRRLSVSWNNVPMFSCTGQLYSSQIIIYETSNIIETHILNKSLCTSWNSGNAVHGLHNSTGTLATVVPGRNNTQWVATNEGTRFTPNGAATYTVNWYSLPGPVLLASNTFTSPPTTPPFISNITVTPTLNPQYFYAEVTGPNGCGPGVPNTDTVVVFSSSLFVDAGPYTSICEGSSTTLNASAPGAVSYSWSPSTGLSDPSISNPVASPTVTTTYTVSAIDGVGCTGFDTVTVGVSPAPFADAGFGSGICAGDNIMLSGSGSGTYLWSPGSSLDDSTIASPTASPLVTTTYTMTVTDAIGCTASDTATVFLLNPVSSAGPDVSICIGDSTLLNASGGTSYVWSPGTGLSSTTIGNPIAFPSSTTTYTVTATDASSGCSASDMVTVTVNPLPIADAGPYTEICIGSNTTLSASGGASYSWSPATGLSDPAISNPVANPVITTTYTVTVTSGAGCESTDTVTIQVNPLPVVDAGSDVSICVGASTTLNASGAVSYSWSPAGSLSNPNIFNPVASPSAETTYTVTGTDANGCVNTDTVHVDLNGISITISPAVAMCFGDSTTLSSTGASTYSWSPSAGLSSTTISNPIAFPTATTTYTVIGTATTGCADTAMVTVTINPLPVVDAGATASICSGSNATLNGSGANSYLWSPSTGLSNVNIPNPVASPTATVLYTLTGTDLNGCVNSDTVSVIVLPVPAAGAGANTSICQGSSVTLNGTGGGSYAWSPSTGLSSTTIANPVATPATTTSYTVTVTGSNGCTQTDQVTITVNPSPTASAGAGVSICLGASTTLSASGGTSYSWSPAAGLSSTTVSNPTATPGSTTLYIVTVSNAAGCSDTASTLVVVNNTMSLGAGSVTPETCDNLDGSLTAGAITGGGSPYTYSINGGPSQSSATFTGLSAGSYTLTVTDAGGCSVSQVLNVGMINGVNAGITATPSSGVSPLVVSFGNTSTGATSYVIDYGDGSLPSTTLSHTYTLNGTYTVMLIAMDGPCVDTALLTVNVFDEVLLVVPNIFTPNGDQTNDVFRIQNMGVKELNGMIFNRWGNKIATWSGVGANDGWDGKINGKTADDGTYYYIIQATGYDGQNYEQKGYLQLLGNN